MRIATIAPAYSWDILPLFAREFCELSCGRKASYYDGLNSTKMSIQYLMAKRFPQKIEVADVAPVQLYDFQQKVLFSPTAQGEGFIKLTVTKGERGAQSVPHSHPRDEVTLTLEGEAVLRAGELEFHMKPGTALRIPPGCVHQVEVLSAEWTVVAAYCDECQLCRPDMTTTRSQDST